MKRDRELRNKKAELTKVREELREVGLKLGEMYRTPKHLPEYSSGKVAGWEKEHAKLEERELKLHLEIEELTLDPERQQEITTRKVALVARLTKIRNDRDALRSKYDDLRYSLPEKVAKGGDPVKLAAELWEMKKEIEALDRAGTAIQAGLTYLTKLGQPG